MNKKNLLFWIPTVLFAALMIFSSIPNIMLTPEVIKMLGDQLHYPNYFIQFIGIAKILGSFAILIPGYYRIKEWAYAGLIFDLVGAVYSFFAVGEPFQNVLPMFIFIALGFASYFFYHRKYNIAN